MVLTLGVVDGIQILVARRLGEGRVRAAGQTFNQGLLVLTAASLVLTSAVLQLAAPVSGMVVVWVMCVRRRWGEPGSPGC